MIKNTKERYGRVAQAFHWTTALLILTLIPLGVFMHELPNGTSEEIALKVWLYSLHKTLGVTVLAIAVLRIVWAVINPRPVPLHPERRLETFAAETVHWILYAGIILAPLTGLLHHAASTGFAPIWWPFGQDLPFIPKSERLAAILGAAHWAMAAAISVSVAAHIVGALKHVIIDKDHTLARMVKGANTVIIVPDRHSKMPAVNALIAFLVLGGAVGAASTYVWAKSQPAAAAASEENGVTVAAGQAAGQNAWVVDYPASTLGIEISQLGSPVEGKFATWQADINFDPENLAASRVNVMIDVASLSVGTVSSQAIGPEFLDAAAHPQAVFAADKFTAVGDKSFEAEGTLTLHGVTQPLTLPFDLVIDGDTATMTAEVELDRLTYEVGAQGYANEDSVGFEVKVDIDLTASRAGTVETQPQS